MSDEDQDRTRRIPVASRDVPAGVLYMGQLKGRVLPVAAVRFADQLSAALADRYEVT